MQIDCCTSCIEDSHQPCLDVCEEDNAHSALERVPIAHLVTATQFYAAFPLVFQYTLEQMK